MVAGNKNCEILIKNNKEFYVYEIKTDQILFRYSNHSEAKKVVNLNNNGGGFNGFTPSFLTEK